MAPRALRKANHCCEVTNVMTRTSAASSNGFAEMPTSSKVAMFKLCSKWHQCYRHLPTISDMRCQLAVLSWTEIPAAPVGATVFVLTVGLDVIGLYWTWPIPKMFELWVYVDVQHSKFSWLLLIWSKPTYCYCVFRLHLYSYLQLQGRCLSVVELWERKTMTNRSSKRLKR